MKGTYGLGFNLTLTEKNDSAVLKKHNAINNANIKTNSIPWYVPHYTLSITKQNILMSQIIKKMATDLQYPERSVLMKEVNTQSLSDFELGTREGI